LATIFLGPPQGFNHSFFWGFSFTLPILQPTFWHWAGAHPFIHLSTPRSPSFHSPIGVSFFSPIIFTLGLHPIPHSFITPILRQPTHRGTRPFPFTNSFHFLLFPTSFLTPFFPQFIFHPGWSISFPFPLIFPHNSISSSSLPQFHRPSISILQCGSFNFWSSFLFHFPTSFHSQGRPPFFPIPFFLPFVFFQSRGAPSLFGGGGFGGPLGAAHWARVFPLGFGAFGGPTQFLLFPSRRSFHPGGVPF